MKRGISVLVGVALAIGLFVSLEAQGPSPAQIQAALRAFLTQDHTWTGTQTFAGAGGGGTIAGLTAGRIPVASGATTLVDDPHLTWTIATSLLNLSATLSEIDAVGLGIYTVGGGLILGNYSALNTEINNFSGGSVFTQVTGGGVISLYDPAGGIQEYGSVSQSQGTYTGVNTLTAFASPSTVVKQNNFQTTYDVAGASTNLFANLVSQVDLGTTTPSAGPVTANLVQVTVKGATNAGGKSLGAFAEGLRMYVNIGTGFTQTTGPSGDAWIADEALLGPIAVQPRQMVGRSTVLNNYYNGSPSGQPSVGHFLVTYPGAATLIGGDATHAAANTYPLDVGFAVVGYSTAAAVDGIGWTTAVQIGGSLTPFGESKSLIGTGMAISQYATAGLSFGAATVTTVPAITITGANPILLGNAGYLAGNSTSGNTYTFNVYDNNTGPASVAWATMTNGNTPSVVITPPTGGTTLAVTANEFATSSTQAVSVANVGANSCGTTAATIAGNDNAGAITVGTVAGTQCRITFVTAAATRRHCTANDETTTIAVRSTYVSTTTTDLLGAFVAGDVLTYTCFAR